MVIGKAGRQTRQSAFQSGMDMGILMTPVLRKKAEGPVQNGLGFLGYLVVGEVCQSALTRRRAQKVAHGFMDRPVDRKSKFSQCIPQEFILITAECWDSLRVAWIQDVFAYPLLGDQL